MTKETTKDDNKNALGGCAILIVIIFFAIWSCSPSAEEEAQEAAKLAADKEKGFHCLSGWDGSSLQFTTEVKELLRDPESFEHIETKITPKDKDSKHIISMKYRARNGFGGMNVGEALGVMDNNDCNATVTILDANAIE